MYSFNNVLSRFSGTRKSSKNLRLTITIHHFNVKLAFFAVFVLTLQTGFAARWCFRFSANDSSIEQVCPPLVCTMCKEARTVTRGARGETRPWENFSSPRKNVLDKIQNYLDIVQIFSAPLRNSSLPVVSKLVTFLKEACVKKKLYCQKREFFEQCSL